MAAAAHAQAQRSRLLAASASRTAQSKEAYELARRYRQLGVMVVMGGLHVTSLPEEAVELGVAAAVGEGEIIWPEILEDAQRGRLKPIYDAPGRQFDLADAPMPAAEHPKLRVRPRTGWERPSRSA